MIVFRDFEVVFCLKIQPELRARFEIARQSQGRIGRDAAPLGHDVDHGDGDESRTDDTRHEDAGEATGAQVARRMGAAPERIAAIERAEPGATEVRTLAAYVEAMGGQLDVTANFGGERVVLR